MLIVAIAWIYVVGMASIVEALSPQGTVLGALVTFVFYGVAPLSVVLYLLGTPARKKARRRAEAAALTTVAAVAAATDVDEGPSGTSGIGATPSTAHAGGADQEAPASSETAAAMRPDGLPVPPRESRRNEKNLDASS
ncbi:MAG: hypothetical protein HZC37_23025 [Burkholderiales bacterium]|nr:hypothetical protein [Burkholderiales bacterium]